MKKRYKKPPPEFFQVEIVCPEVCLHPVAIHFVWIGNADESGVVQVEVARDFLENIAGLLGD
ncbi:hypothetical protein DQP57_00130 [Mycobacterium colombiense]|uniref:Uncharacterized protein n=1 Tax=Mycobacterium colombiense TaxID=339268 RepID=A0A329MBN0_9MYCO|nr:hypothetical protein [Mycobacterium colombiense]RAV17469.1 hypothetical protein DQP57_00130 [Mycobacterium colombiense]